MSRLTPSLLALDKGLDLQTAKIIAPEGSVFDTLNYEQVDFQGQKRIDGFVRYDGSTLSAVDEYRVLTVVSLTPSLSSRQLLFKEGKLFGLVALTSSNRLNYIVIDNTVTIYAGDTITLTSYETDGSSSDLSLTAVSDEQGKDTLAVEEDHYNSLLQVMSSIRNKVEELPAAISGLHWFKDRLYAVAGLQAFEAPEMVGDYDDEILADSPVAYWKLDDALGSVSYTDSSGNGVALHKGLASPNSPVMQSGPLRIAGQSARFDAISSLSCDPGDPGFPSLAVSSDRKFSLECIIETPTWLGTSRAHIIRKIVYSFSTTFYNDYVLGFDVDGTPRLVFGWTSNGTGSERQIKAPFELEAGKIYHVLCTSDVDDSTDICTVRMYINGALVEESSNVQFSEPPLNSNNSLTINAQSNWGTWGFEGRVSDIAIYNYALSSERAMIHAMAAGLGQIL